MKWRGTGIVAACAVTVVACLICGCRKKEVATADPKAMVDQLKKAFPNAKVDAGPDTNGVAFVQAPKLEGMAPQINVDAYVGAAAQAIGNNEHVAAFKILNLVQRQPNLSSDQLMSLHDSMRELQQNLIRRAEAGDAQALQALHDLKNRAP